MNSFQTFLKDELGKTKPVFDDSFQFEIGNKIKELRLKKNLSQKELSNLCNIPQGKISKIENGAMNITLSTLETIFNALGYKIHITEEPND